MKEVLGEAQQNPGYALREVLRKRLHHMVHVYSDRNNSKDSGDPDGSDDSDTLVDLNVSNDSDASDELDWIFDHALFTYLIDFPAKALRFLKQGEHDRDVWVDVPLVVEDQLELLSDFDILEIEKERAYGVKRFLRKGPEDLSVVLKLEANGTRLRKRR